MADLHTRTATFASLKCRSKCDIFAPKGRVKNKGKRAVFPYDKASSRKPCLSLSFLDCAAKSQCQTKADSAIESPPSQSNCNKQIIIENKKQQANLACCFFLLFARCILISYSVNLISRHTNRTSNLTDRILFAF